MIRLISIYLKPYLVLAILAPLLMLLEVAMDLMQPIFMARIIDYGISEGNVKFILLMGLRMLGIALIGVLGGLGCVALSNIASQNFSADLRADIFAKIQSFSFVEVDKFKTGSLITRLTNDVTQVQTVVAMMMRLMIRAPLLFLGGLTMAFIINARMAVVLVATVPILVIVLTILIKKGFILFNQVQKKLDRVNVVLQENLSGIGVIKAFDRAEFEQDRFGGAVNDLMANLISAAKISSIAMPAVMFIMNLGVIGVIWLGGIEVSAANMEMGEVMAFISYTGQILFSLAMMAMLLMFLSRAKASSDRINEIFNTDPLIKINLNNSVTEINNTDIRFENVSFGYDGDANPLVLKDISFSARPGEIIAILGTTGSGKSSMVNLIPRLYDVTKGKVLLGGIDVKDIPMDLLRQKIGVVLQETVLLSGSITDNIRFGRENASDDDVIEAAKTAQIHDFISSLPDGYNTMLGQRGVNLSGGQKQRLAIARALVKKPAVLILDDSTSAVDSETEMNIHRAIRNYVKGVTCILVAQRIASIIETDKIIVMDEGQIISQGKHNFLLDNCSVYREMFRSQCEEEAS